MYPQKHGSELKYVWHETKARCTDTERRGEVKAPEDCREKAGKKDKLQCVLAWMKTLVHSNLLTTDYGSVAERKEGQLQLLPYVRVCASTKRICWLHAEARTGGAGASSLTRAPKSRGTEKKRNKKKKENKWQ